MFYITTEKRKCYQLLLCSRFLRASLYSCYFEKTIHLFEFSKHVYHKREAMVFPLSLYKWISLFLFWYKRCLINALNSDCACLIANKYKKIHRVFVDVCKHSPHIWEELVWFPEALLTSSPPDTFECVWLSYPEHLNCCEVPDRCPVQVSSFHQALGTRMVSTHPDCILHPLLRAKMSNSFISKTRI